MKWQISLSKNLQTKRNVNIQKTLASFLLFWQVQISKKLAKIGKKLAKKKVSLEINLRKQESESAKGAASAWRRQ